MKVLTFQKDAVIFLQGELAESMFDILSGSVGVYVGYGTEFEKQLTVLKAGDFLGEMGLIERYPRSATAVALEDGTKLQEIEEKEFYEFFQHQPERLLSIMRQLSERLRDRTDDYESANRMLEELKGTQGNPEKRSDSLLAMAKNLVNFYNSVADAFGETAFMNYFPSDRYHY
ncbi:MAG: cyclic nucleotide-binding domain-containing protein [Clostridia bacterium]|nr:cyclic nucleotide-binding domain-containing protein [Oscillospiraceae bacterium]MBO5570645.1 cyclic nucleotide-binding domain-containing protein [Clostridia bacterium]